MDYEYKCVGAPERPKRSRGAKTGSQRLAVAMEEIIQEEAVDGWEYMRTDLVPVIEKTSVLGRAHEVHRAVLVFRREIAPRRGAARSRRLQEDAAGAFEDGPLRPRPSPRGRTAHDDYFEAPEDPFRTEPTATEEPPRRRRSVLSDEPMRLNAEDMIEPPRRDRKPPSGLG